MWHTVVLATFFGGSWGGGGGGDGFCNGSLGQNIMLCCNYVQTINKSWVMGLLGWPCALTLDQS